MAKNIIIGTLLLTMAGAFIFPQSTTKIAAHASNFCADYDMGPHKECPGPATSATTRKAWEIQNKIEGDCTGNNCYGMDGGFVRSERWKNYNRYAKYLPRVQDVVQVEIMDDTVSIVDADGRRATFWLKGDAVVHNGIAMDSPNVSGITSY